MTYPRYRKPDAQQECPQIAFIWSEGEGLWYGRYRQPGSDEPVVIGPAKRSSIVQDQIPDDFRITWGQRPKNRPKRRRFVRAV